MARKKKVQEPVVPKEEEVAAEQAPIVDDLAVGSEDPIAEDAGTEDVDAAPVTDDISGDEDGEGTPIVDDEEPTVDPVPEPSKETPEIDLNADKKLNIGEVMAIIGASDLSGVEKLNKIATGAVAGIAVIAGKVLAYNEAMKPGAVIDANAGVGKQYDLLNTLKSVAGTEDYDMFRVKFAVINLGFLTFEKEAFNEFKLFRYDNVWKWSKKDLVTLQNLITVIHTLADGSTRATNIAKIDLDAALNLDEITLNNTGVNNIKKYYTA